MTPQEQNILNALNLITLVHNSHIKLNPDFPPELKATITITKEHLSSSNLSIPTFINTLKILAEKGYLTAVSFFEEEYHSKTKDFYKPNNFNKTLKELKSAKENTLTIENKKQILKGYEKILPINHNLNTDVFLKEKITFSDLASDTKKILGNHSSNDISIILLFPFRDIYRLLKKMNEGIPFDNIQDSNIWYDSLSFKFHFGNNIIDTAYRGTPSKVHFILDELFNNLEELVIDYGSIKDLDDLKGIQKINRSCANSMYHFVDKNPELKKFFHIYSDRLEINNQYKNDIS